jgi:SAM-dependent methyltransferase
MYRLSDLACREDLGVYFPVAGGTAEFGYSDGDAAEDYILQCIRQAKDVSDNSSELVRCARDWPSYYHLAAGRANHIRVLDLPYDIAILELGAGCGAVSRYLAENHRTLHAIEGSPRRALIARERCRGLDNAKVYCADFRELELEPNYDIVLLNGVLEYAPVLFGDRGRAPDEATAALLRLAGSALAANGAAIIAIENKIGLKYWCGAGEDHTGRLYDGIHGYPTPGTARTYSRRELTKLLAASGLGDSRFFSCFPDYKFASSILASDNGAPSDRYFHNWIPYPAETPGLDRQYLIHEGLAARTLNDAGLIHELANSFLVVAAPALPAALARSFDPAWIAAKVSVANRDKALHCLTKFYPRTEMVEKRLIDYGERGSSGTSPVGHAAKSSPWKAGHTLSWEVANAAMSKGFREALTAILAEYHAELLRRFALGTHDADGYPLLRGESFDFIMANIIRAPTGLEGIDDEWQVDRVLTADFILFRSLCYDTVGQNRHWLRDRVPDGDAFVFAMVRTIYPSYCRKRHARNRSLEASMLQEVRGALGATKWESPCNPVAWKRVVKALARKVPPAVGKRFIRFSGAIHEKVQAVFTVY